MFTGTSLYYFSDKAYLLDLRKIVRSQSELSRAKTVLSEGEVAVATSKEEKLFVFDSEVSPQAQTRRVADRIRPGDGGVLRQVQLSSF